MVKASFKDDEGVCHVAIGLSRGNIERLIEGRPIYISQEDAEKMGVLNAQFLLFFGETELHIEKMMREHALIGPSTIQEGTQT